MHGCMFIVFSKLVWNWVWFKHPWALVSQIELWTMLFYVFTSVFPEISPRGSVLMLLNLSLSLEVQSGISRFRTPARAEIGTLERGIRASSISALFYSPLERRIGRSSGIACLTLERASSVRQAEISPIQHFWLFCRTLERVILRSSGCLCLHVRSSGVTYARAGLCFLKNLKLLLKVHLCILISF